MENPWKKKSKISPQTENGHRRIATDVLQALIRQKMAGSEWAICMAVIDKTYGHQKLSDKISLSQFMQSTGFTRQAVIDAISSLERRHILVVNHTRPINEYLFNKHHDTWMENHGRLVNRGRASQPQLTMSGSQPELTRNGQPQLTESSQPELTHNRKKEKRKKEKGLEYPSWLNLDLWKEFKKHRVKKKAPMTEHAEELLIKELKELMNRGFKQDDIINQSIKIGWKGLFPIKTQEKEERKLKDFTTYRDKEEGFLF